MNKATLREKYLSLRLALTKPEYDLLNEKIRLAFFSSVDLSAISTLHTFLPLSSKREPDTWLLIEHLKKEFPHIRISIPKMQGDGLVSFYFEDKTNVRENKWGIFEPLSGEVTPTEKIDLVIVPLLACDKNGNRVGYGKGFYDRFLSECRPDCKKVGLSFFEPVDAISDIDHHDVKLDAVILPA